MGRLIDTMREMVPGARLCLPMLPYSPEMKMNHVVDFPPEDIVDLPPLETVIRSQQYILPTRRVLKQFADSVDVLFMRVPFQIPLTLQGLGKPKVMHIAGNPIDVIKASSDYRGMMKRLALGYARHTCRVMRRMVREPHTRVASNGREMWDLLGCRQGRVVVSSCIFQREMQPRENLDLSDPPRILSVAYLRPEKGVGYLLEAFEMLRKSRPLKLTLVGGSDRATGAEAIIQEQIRRSPFREDITLAGMVDFGDPLFDHYRSADVFVVASLSEGTPRTLVEARAFGCPAVATRVGGIPSSVDDGRTGLLVEPRDAAGLANAIDRILTDEALRRKLIAAGLQGAQQQTLEYFAAQLVDEVRLVTEEARRDGVPMLRAS
jgi:glycosyltransferase involved in cell wall biosynthesis